MKVTGWTYLENDKYQSIDDMTNEEFREARQAVIDECHKKGYKFSGAAHQNRYDGCPIIDDKYVYSVSMRSWGSIMQEAHNLPNEDGLGYVIWAWSTPDNEQPKYPTEV